MRASRLQRGLVAATLRLNRLRPLRRITGLPYDACVAALARVCARIPSVRALYIPRPYNDRQWMPGSSDLDLLLVLHVDQPPELQARGLERFWRELRALGRTFPFLSTGLNEVPVFTEEDLELPHFGWRCMALPAHAPPHSWTLVYGEDVRPLIRSWEPSPPRQVPASPDLLGLLDKHLHPKIIDRIPAPAGYLGSELRLAAKVIRCLRHLSNSDRPGGSDDAWPTGEDALDPDGQLRRLMERLSRTDGYTRGSRAARTRLGFLLVRAMDRYNASLIPLDRATEPLAGGQVTPPPAATRLVEELSRRLPASVSALVYPRTHLLGPGRPVYTRPLLGLWLVLQDEDPEAYAHTLKLVRDLLRPTPVRVQPRVMGPHSFAASLSLCGTNYALESFHLRRTNLAVAGRPPLADPGTPSARTLDLAILRRLTVERCHKLRSCLDSLMGRPFATCLNPLLSLASYRLWLTGAGPLTVGSETLAAHEANFPDQNLTRRLADLARVSPAAPVNRTLLEAYRACALDMLEASCRRA
jgi:hypothetical protein